MLEVLLIIYICYMNCLHKVTNLLQGNPLETSKKQRDFFICGDNIFLFFRLDDVLQVYKESSNTKMTIALYF